MAARETKPYFPASLAVRYLDVANSSVILGRFGREVPWDGELRNTKRKDIQRRKTHYRKRKRSSPEKGVGGRRSRVGVMEASRD